MLTEITVLWGDHDAFNHVNNLAYLRWCETARVQYFERIGLYPEMPLKGLGPILASQTCHYRRTLNYPDTVTIGTRITGIGNSSMRMSHAIVSRASGELAAESESVIVTVDYSTGKPVRVPDEIRRAVANIEGRDFSKE